MPLSITSGFRSRADQQRLYDLFRAGKGNPANPPGRSRHETGHAADLGPRRALGWAHAAAGRYGLRFPYSHEPWHVEHDDTASFDDQEDDMAKLVTTDGRTVYSVTAQGVEHVPGPTALATLRRHKLVPSDPPERISADELAALRAATSGTP